MAAKARLGIIGSGMISGNYLSLARLFKGLEIVACADLVAEAAKARAAEFSIRAMTADELLKTDDIDAVINLTIPAVHYDISLSILTAGKHAFSEKPLAMTSRQANRLVAEADKRGLKLGGAPDTFLGGAGQTARRLIDKGTIGEVIAGSAQVMSHGMEHWHATPAFFYQPGGGPIFDTGPYYITTLVNMLGPVKTVAAMAKRGFPHRLVTAEGPMKGRKIPVGTPTTINAVLTFHGGAQITLGGSWDVWKHGHTNPIELYGAKGTMLVPDPNFFGGIVRYSDGNGDYVEYNTGLSEPFAADNFQNRPGLPMRSNYRMLGVADLIEAAAKKREPRCSGRLAAHVVEVMESILKSAETQRFITLKTKVERPKPLTAADASRLAVEQAARAA